ncbi:hypothetical protein GCM10018962_05720 [Dactylosporangium matsuzakiense]|uniref:Uncharacterized protein n=1 Tax=Dactylosporangium matsuzakiense TaxID=53360 RepID=A0A9W6KBR0_9ACTN|nr:hypothetical protein GCM10017581_003230 [Dactylosporangium matsuzakiense]
MPAHTPPGRHRRVRSRLTRSRARHPRVRTRGRDAPTELKAEPAEARGCARAGAKGHHGHDGMRRVRLGGMARERAPAQRGAQERRVAATGAQGRGVAGSGGARECVESHCDPLTPIKRALIGAGNKRAQGTAPRQ